MNFSRQEYWRGLPFPSPGDLPYPGNEPGLLHWRQILYRLSHQGGQIGTLVIVICSNHFKTPVQQCYLRYYCLCLKPGEKIKGVLFCFFLSRPHFPESRDPWSSEKWPQCVSGYITMSCDKFCNWGMKQCCVYGFPWISSSLSLGKMKFVKYVFMPLSALGASVSLIFCSTHSRLLPKISCPWHRLSFCHLMHPQRRILIVTYCRNNYLCTEWRLSIHDRSLGCLPGGSAHPP